MPNDPRFANMVERVRNRVATDKTVGDSCAMMPRDELLQHIDTRLAKLLRNVHADPP